MGLQRKSEQRWSSPANPDPMPLAAPDPNEVFTECPACKVPVRPGSVLCVQCGSHFGPMETKVTTVGAIRAPCPKCGYDLSGISGTTCPECGGDAPVVLVSLSELTEISEPVSAAEKWQWYRRPTITFAVGFVLMLMLAGSWYGPRGVLFWLAVVIPAWFVASVGYLVLGAIIRFLDTSIPLTLTQVAGVVMFGLAATTLSFPYNAGKVVFSLRGLILVFAGVALVTRYVMEDDDFWDCFFASLPISCACLAVPMIALMLLP